MLVNFNVISENSRIWIYAAEEKLTYNQEHYILNYISNHLRHWKSHESPLTAAVTILEARFIIVALDESKGAASGCAIDTLQKVIENLERELSISVFNRMNVFCKIEGKIMCVPSSKLEHFADSNTLFYDLTIQKKLELNSYLKPISKGWCAQLV